MVPVAPCCSGAHLLVALAPLCGCGSGKSKSIVTGKVTVNGKAPAGGSTLVFIGSDNKEVSAVIAEDGSYTMIDAPKGEVKVAVRGLSATIGGGQPAVKMGSDMPGMKSKAQGAPIPPKYAQPNNGLTFNVSGGKQTKDFDLQGSAPRDA